MTPQETTMMSAVQAADKARAAAILAKDFDALANYLSQDLIYVHSSSTREDKEQYLTKLRNAFYVYSNFEKGDVTWRFAGDCAFMNGSVVIHVTVNGTPKVVRATYLSVWRNEGGVWRMFAWQSTPAPQA
jgi:ketosteroid isomerase-like protein